MRTPEWITDPVKFRRFNGWACVLWFIAAFPICVFLKDSVAFLVFVSVYAVVTGHLSTWQAARVEVNQEQQSDTDFEKIEKKVDQVHGRLGHDAE